MSALARYLAEAGQPSMFDAEQGYDELVAPDGTPRPSWAPLVGGLEQFTGDLTRAQREVARLLEDDGVTYTPAPVSTTSILAPDAPAVDQPLARARPWLLDPVPLVLDAREWTELEAGLAQRAELLAAILADLYGAQRLLADRLVPPAAVLDHDEFLRPLVRSRPSGDPGPFLLAVDLGRDVDGRWKVLADRTQAPSGVGYAMQDRRVVSQVLPELYASARLRRLTPFFHALRMALVDAAPPGVEDPRVVVLSPGPLSETAFDQAFVASLLGFPLVEGSDLTVADGRVWLRTLGRREQVHVILRRVDSIWADPLELRAGSRLGVPGLVSAVRQGTVRVVNPLGSGALENPALLPFLPEMCRRLLGEPLRLASADTWWCGDPASLSHVLAHLDELVIRPISRNAGRSVLGSALTVEQRATLAATISQAPHRFVGQEVLRLSSAPSSRRDQLVRRDVVLRSFAVWRRGSPAVMPGGLARVTGAIRQTGDLTRPEGGLAKDVWVVGTPETAPESASLSGDPGFARPPAGRAAAAASMAPRVLDDLFWFGRYAERAEDLLRLVLATRTVAIESDPDRRTGGPLDALLTALTHVSTTYPGFTAGAVEMAPELRSLVLDRARAGTAAQALVSLSRAAAGVRDQLSADVFVVLADMDRALAQLAKAPAEDGLELAGTGERVLTGLLALAGIVSENMIRDPGWHLLDLGRGLERALQLVRLLRVTVVDVRAAEVDRVVVEAVLTAAESGVTFRRRHRDETGTRAVVELLVLDPQNPRSVAFQVDRLRADVGALPGADAAGGPLPLLNDLDEGIAAADAASLTRRVGNRRPELADFLGDLQTRLDAVATAVAERYLRLPSPQPLGRSLVVADGTGDGQAVAR